MNLFLVLCIFFGLRGRDNSGENVENGAWITAEELEQSGLGQIQADLQEMADYLERLDASVTYNKEELQNLTTVQGDSLNTIQEYLDNLKQEISALKEEFSSYESTNTSYLEESVNTGLPISAFFWERCMKVSQTHKMRFL